MPNVWDPLTGEWNWENPKPTTPISTNFNYSSPAFDPSMQDYGNYSTAPPKTTGTPINVNYFDTSVLDRQMVSPTQQTTGQMGGIINAATPQIGAYNTNPVQNNNFTQTINDWTKGITSAWDNIFNPKPAQPTTPFWEAQPVQAAQAEQNPYMTQGYGATLTPKTQEYPGFDVPTGFNVSKPYQPPAGFGTPSYFTATNEKTGLPNISEPAVQTQAKGLIEQGNDKVLMESLDAFYKGGQKLPDISPERLNKITDINTIAQLWDTGYRVPNVYQQTVSNLTTFNGRSGNLMNFNPDDLNSLDYSSIQNIKTNLAELTDQDFAQMRDEGLEVFLDKKYIGVNAKGEPMYSATLNTRETQYKTKEEKEAEAKAKRAQTDAEDIAKYWSPEMVADRNKRRQESDDYQTQKNNEGYSDFFKILDGLKMPPQMDEYFRANFNDLRREWQVSGSGLSWEQWIQNYDFKGKFGKFSPSQRGERPQVYSPRMRSVS